MSDLTYAYVGDVIKSERDDNGDLIVYGKATGPDLDLDGQRCAPVWLKQAMPAWMKWGNVREQHSAIAAGVGVELTEQGDDWWLKSLVVDKGTAEKVEKGVLKGYSIGIRGARITKSADAPNGLINSGVICEVSLVDRPANASCQISIAKSADGMMTPVDCDGASVLKAGDELTIADGEVTVKFAAADTTKAAHVDTPADGSETGKTATVVEGEPAELAEDDPEPVTKATDIDNLTAPAPGQECLRCGEAGHLFCSSDPDLSVGDVSTVNLALTKATAARVNKDGSDVSEESDILGARRALAIIGALIGSEAAELPDKPEQSWDIRLLLQAASALHQFINNEHDEEVGAAVAGAALTDCSTVELAAEPKVTKATEPDVAEPDVAEPDVAVPVTNKAAGAAIPNPDDLAKAITAVFADPESDISKTLTAIVEDSTRTAAEALNKSLTDIGARLAQVEQMAAPGGPALRPSAIEKQDAHRGELAAEFDKWTGRAERTDDLELRKGYESLAKASKVKLDALTA